MDRLTNAIVNDVLGSVIDTGPVTNRVRVFVDILRHENVGTKERASLAFVVLYSIPKAAYYDVGASSSCSIRPCFWN
jgi:hypothetical protein